MNAHEKIGTLIMTVFEKLGREKCTLSSKSDYWQIDWEDGPTKSELSKAIRAALPDVEPMIAVRLNRSYSSEFLYAIRSTAAYVTGEEQYSRANFSKDGFVTGYSSQGALLQSFIEDMDAALFMRYGPVNRANLMDQALAILQAPENEECEDDREEQQPFIAGGLI